MCNIDYLSSQDMFPDVELVYSVRNELDTVIEEGVSNIVQLLRNADSGSTSGAARAGATDEDAFESKNRKIRQGWWWRTKSVELLTSSPHAPL